MTASAAAHCSPAVRSRSRRLAAEYRSAACCRPAPPPGLHPGRAAHQPDAARRPACPAPLLRPPSSHERNGRRPDPPARHRVVGGSAARRARHRRRRRGRPAAGSPARPRQRGTRSRQHRLCALPQRQPLRLAVEPAVDLAGNRSELSPVGQFVQATRRPPPGCGQRRPLRLLE